MELSLIRKYLPFPLFCLTLLVAGLACGGGGGGGGASNAPLQLRADLFYRSPQFLVGLAFTPDGDLLLSELQTGKIRFFPKGQTTPNPQEFAKLPVPGDGVRGLLGVAVDPDFGNNHYVYVYQTAPGPLRNRVVRFTANGAVGTKPVVIIDNIPTGGHDGGKFAFDKDGNLFISTGDAGDPSLAPDLASLAGKILRIKNDGSIPQDNPFPGSPIYALGFRNVFGMALHPDGQTLYASDNGPDCDDEVNRILPGGNYGWRPGYVCGEKNPQTIPAVFSVSPSAGVTGILFPEGAEISQLNESLLVGTFNQGDVRRLLLDEEQGGLLLFQDLVFAGGSGNIIDLAQSPDGQIYFSTSEAIFKLSAPENDS